MKNAQRNYNTLKWLYDKVDLLAKAGRLPKEEQERARQETLQALDIYILAEKEYKQALDEFKITLSLPTTAEFRLDSNELEALRKAEIIYPDFTETEAIKTALVWRLDLANSADSIIDAERKVYVATDGLKADANLVGYSNFVSSKKGDRRSLGSLQKEYGLDIELNLPLDRVAEQNTYRKALITLNQRQREYEQASDTVKLEVRQAYRDLKEAAQRYRVQIEGLKLADKRLKNTFLLLQYGRASSRRFLNAQNDLFDAQNAATQAMVNYIVASLNFYRDTEVLQVRPDGMWEKSIDRKVPIASSSLHTVNASVPPILIKND
jgi:outer membrane protein TolC